MELVFIEVLHDESVRGDPLFLRFRGVRRRFFNTFGGLISGPYRLGS
jgi:hypothetical protein